MIGTSRFGRAVWAILRKECRTEWRTRYGLDAALLFAVTTLVTVSFAAGRIADRPDVLGALLWIVLLFAALASLAHTFVREADAHTLTFLRLVASPVAIAAGKLAFNLVFLLVLEAVTVPMFFLLTNAPAPRWDAFLGLLALGSVALASVSTLVGAIVAQTRGRGALFAAVSLPLLLPVMAAGVSGTKGQWQNIPVTAELRLLAGFTAAVLAASVLLYDHVWNE